MLVLPQWVLLLGGLSLLMVVQELPFISWYLLSLISLGGEGRHMVLSYLLLEVTVERVGYRKFCKETFRLVTVKLGREIN